MDSRRMLDAARSGVRRAAGTLSAVSRVPSMAVRVGGLVRRVPGAVRRMPGAVRRMPGKAGGPLGAARWVWTAARRKWRLVVTFACVASMAAGITLAAIPHRGGTPPNAGILAPGSQGSLSQHHSWWDPRGWLGGNGAPSSHTLTNETLALPSHSRMPRQQVAPPAHRSSPVRV
jgi:hypothetical protein